MPGAMGHATGAGLTALGLRVRNGCPPPGVPPPPTTSVCHWYAGSRLPRQVKMPRGKPRGRTPASRPVLR